MSFSKANYAPEIAIAVSHAWHPGEVFTFYLPKVLPQAALDAEAAWIGVPSDERGEASRVALIQTVAAMLTREPEGFDDFPGDKVMESGVHARPLRERVVDYFNDPTKPELEAILVSVWRAYREASVPSAYLKSVSRDGDGSRRLPRTASATAA